MSIEEALNTNALRGSDISNTENGQVLNLPTEKLYIGNINIDILSFRVCFEMNELCDIFIRSYPKSADYIDALENDAIIIADKFEKKYGKPTKSLNKKVSILDFNDRPIYLRSWDIGGYKSISITLWKERYEYYYQISIISWKHPIKKDIEKGKKEVQKQKERKKLEEYQF